jgi:L-ascorbate metabolism protein UlaG (beta-lactamase superfamily)
MNKSYYLKPNVVVEPLVDYWYAWAHLISPATAALNITGRHLKIMDSFILAPDVHIDAVKNPKMLGGPFMDIPKEQRNEVRELRQWTLEKRKQMLKLSAALKQLDHLIQNASDGFSLESLYARVPDELKGYVELVYDLNNHASYRLFEALLYQSEYYDKTSQSIALWLTENDDRPFVLSTPRLADKNVLHIPVPFDHIFIDELCKMRRKPGDPERLKEMIKLTAGQEAIFDSLFTENAPAPYKPYTGDKIRMRYFGHACVLLETSEVSVLIDPVISYYGYQTDVSRFSDLDLPETIDYVIITHNHQDHILFETLLQIRHKIKNLVIPRSTSGALQDPNLKLMFKNCGFNNIIEIDAFDEFTHGEISFTGVPFIGEHCDLNIQSKVCYHLRIHDFTILFVADSCNLDSKLYELVHRQLGDVDVLMLGMECDGAPLTWLYGPLLTNDIPRDKDSSRRLAGCNYERGMALVNTFNPKEAYVYAMGMEPWLKFISSIRYTDTSNPIVASNKLIEKCVERNIVAERLFGEKELLYKKTRQPAMAEVL